MELGKKDGSCGWSVGGPVLFAGRERYIPGVSCRQSTGERNGSEWMAAALNAKVRNTI